MKKAFSFIELIFCIVILSFVFSTLHLIYMQIYKNYNFLGFFKDFMTWKKAYIIIQNSKI